MTRAQQMEMESLQRRVAKHSDSHEATGEIIGRMKLLRKRVLDEENALAQAVTVERKVHDIECAVDDLTSLAHEPAGLDALRKANLEAIEQRLRHLRFDIQAMQAAE